MKVKATTSGGYGYESWYVLNAADECYEVSVSIVDRYSSSPSTIPTIEIANRKSTISVNVPQKSVNIGKILLIKAAIREYCKSRNIGEMPESG